LSSEAFFAITSVIRLEILSHTLKLTHEEKHRALDDSIAAMELFIRLVEIFESLPEDLIEKMKAS